MRLRWVCCVLVVIVGAGCREAKKELGAAGAAPPSAPAQATKPAVAEPAGAGTAAKVAVAPAARAAGGEAAKGPASGGEAAKAAATEAAKAASQAVAPVPAKVPPVPELLQKRIRYQLRDVSPAPLALREAQLVSAADGSAEVVGFYEFSVYEDCVKREGGSRKAAREKCLPELETIYDYNTPDGEREERQVRLNRECKRYGLFYARVGAALDPAKGSLVVAHVALPEEDCELSSAELALSDHDLDGRRELVAEMRLGREVIEDQRRGTSVADDEHRYLRVLEVGAELRPQFELVVDAQGPGAEVTWVDLDRDERVDLVHKVGCHPGMGMSEEEERQCDDEVRERVWYRYDRELDTWLDDERKQAPEAGGAR